MFLQMQVDRGTEGVMDMEGMTRMAQRKVYANRYRYRLKVSVA
jgi:hypothetical protein